MRTIWNKNLVLHNDIWLKGFFQLWSRNFIKDTYNLTRSKVPLWCTQWAAVMTQLGPIKFPMQLKLKEYKKYIFELKIIQTKYFRSSFISWKMSMYTYMYNPSCSILPTLADQGNSPRSALIACLRLAPYFF